MRFTLVLFLLVVVVLAWLFVKMVLRVSSRGEEPAGAGAWIAALLGLAAWLGVPAALAQNGVLANWDASPPPALALVGALTVLTIALALSPFGGRVAERFSLAALVGFQFFRVPVEWVLHGLAKAGAAPEQMTFAGRNFDIVSGITAALVAFYLVGGGPGRRVVWLWNLVGLALLANVIAIAVLATPAFHAGSYLDRPLNLLPSRFPWVWLPSFLVQAALFGHIVTFRALGRSAAASHSAAPSPSLPA